MYIGEDVAVQGKGGREGGREGRKEGREGGREGREGGGPSGGGGGEKEGGGGGRGGRGKGLLSACPRRTRCSFMLLYTAFAVAAYTTVSPVTSSIPPTPLPPPLPGEQTITHSRAVMCADIPVYTVGIRGRKCHV